MTRRENKSRNEIQHKENRYATAALPKDMAGPVRVRSRESAKVAQQLRDLGSTLGCPPPSLNDFYPFPADITGHTSGKAICKQPYNRINISYMRLSLNTGDKATR